MRSLAWVLIGSLQAATFSFEAFPPREVAVVILASLTVIGILALRVVELSILSRFFVLLYSLPFAATIGYLFDANFIWTRAPNVQPLCLIPEIINVMLSIAIVGLCGLLAGIEAMACWFYCNSAPMASGAESRTEETCLSRTLSLPMTAALLGVSIYLSALHSPAKTIFEEPYAIKSAAKLNASWLGSYMILILLYLDFEREQPGFRRRCKVLGFSAAVAYIIVVLQFLRGDRECAGLVIGLAMLFITRPVTILGTGAEKPRSRLRRALLLATPLTIAVALMAGLGTLRNIANESTYVDIDTRSDSVKYLTRNTWTAVCLNNLGLATDHYYGTIDYLYGRTYLDYFLSLPPSPITKRLNYVRPLDGSANPAQWYRCLISFGGMHPVVVPYRNFGIWGVIPVLFLCGAFISFCELQNERGIFSTRLLYGCVATSSMSWFWYSDMNMVRTLMICGGLYLFFGSWWVPLRRGNSVYRS